MKDDEPKRRVASISMNKFMDQEGRLRGWQPRAQLPQGMIARYTAILKDNKEVAGRFGIEYPICFQDREGNYWLADGFERAYAHIDAGRLYMDVEIRIGTERDAKLYAAGANDKHGTGRTDADIRKCLREVLLDPEWRLLEDEVLADRLNVTKYVVNEARVRLRKEQKDESEEEERVTRDGRRIKVKAPRSKKPVKKLPEGFQICPTCEGKGRVPISADSVQ